MQAATDKAASGVTEGVHTVANEPSLGLYYVIEHIQRGVPALVGIKRSLAQSGEQITGADLDAAFAQEQMSSAVSEDTQRVVDSVQAMADASVAIANSLRK